MILHAVDLDKGEDALDACKKVLTYQNESVFWFLQFPRRHVRPSVGKKIGPLQGAELFEPRTQTLVRAAVLARGDAIAVSVSVEQAELDSELYRVFDATCRSIRLLPD